MSIFDNSLKRIRKFKNLFARVDDLSIRMNKLEENIGTLQVASHRGLVSDNLQDYEFRVFSQGGEDGIIQYLLHKIRPEPEIFVEFGVQNYVEACTRFLLIHDNWRGLVIDGSLPDIDYIRQDVIYWMHDLTAVQAFITRDNINQLISGNGIQGPIGLLTVDIDGNDYWVWEAITCIDPVIVICEYNSLFGPTATVSTPYQADFVRLQAHFSGLYWGASLAALTYLAERKGYILVGSNRFGNNAFFVKADKASGLRPLTPSDAYVKSKFRQSRDLNGRLTYSNFEESLALIRDLPLVDVPTGQNIRVGELGSTV